MRGEMEPPSPENVRGLEAMRPSLEVRAWTDTVVEELGHEPRSEYVELFWLPLLGPTATWLYRRLGAWATAEPDGFSVDVQELGSSVGLGHSLGRRSALGRSLDRLVYTGAARRRPGALEVRRALAPLNRSQLAKLHPSLQAMHEAYLDKNQLTGRSNFYVPDGVA